MKASEIAYKIWEHIQSTGNLEWKDWIPIIDNSMSANNLNEIIKDENHQLQIDNSELRAEIEKLKLKISSNKKQLSRLNRCKSLDEVNQLLNG